MIILIPKQTGVYVDTVVVEDERSSLDEANVYPNRPRLKICSQIWGKQTNIPSPSSMPTLKDGCPRRVHVRNDRVSADITNDYPVRGPLVSDSLSIWGNPPITALSLNQALRSVNYAIIP